MLNILLIRPFVYSTNMSAIPPLGIMYIASSLRHWSKKEIYIEILDMRLKKMDPADLKKKINEKKWDIVGLSTLSYEANRMHSIAEFIKSQDKEILVIAGGPYATMNAEDILKDTNIDITVFGEGERTFFELVEAYDSGIKDLTDIPGIAFRKNDEILINSSRAAIEDLDELPFPAWDLVDLKEYSKMTTFNGIREEDISAPIVTSRACPYQCIYCHRMFGRKWRARSSRNVIKEIKLLYDTYAVRELHIVDDIFNLNKKRVIEICDGIIKNGIKVKMAFPNGLRADIMDEEIIKKLKEAGTYMITYAVETVSERLQKMLKKNLDLEKLKKTIDLTDKYKMLIRGFFMLGFPTETLREIKQTVDFAVKSKLTHAFFFTVIPFEGTELYEYITADKKIDIQDAHYWSTASYYTLATGHQLNFIIIRAYLRFYFNFRRAFKILVRTRRRLHYIKEIFRSRWWTLFLKKKRTP